MDAFGGLGSGQQVAVDLLTDAYRITGMVQTRFARVTDILNQQNSTHLTITQATISEHADPAATVSAPSALVAVSSVLLMVAPALTGEAATEMRIAKRPVRVQFAVPPIRVTGTIHVPPGSRPTEGLLNISDRFLAVTDATISSGAHPELERVAEAAAVCRDLAQVILVTDDEQPDELLAEVLDERTAAFWLNADEEGR
ncbi:MAG: DUF6812 domain-containing protein [Candidatus Limnocylindria bacterium]